VILAFEIGNCILSPIALAVASWPKSLVELGACHFAYTGMLAFSHDALNRAAVGLTSSVSWCVASSVTARVRLSPTFVGSYLSFTISWQDKSHGQGRSRPVAGLLTSEKLIA